MDQLQSYDSDSENASNSAPSMERKLAGPTSLAAEWEEFERLIGTSGGPKTTSACSAANEGGKPSVKTQLDAGSRNHSGTSESEKSETSHQTEDENEDEDAANEESGSGEEDEEEEGSGASESEEDDEEVAPSKLSAASKDSKSKDPKRSHRRSRSRSPRHRESRSQSNSRRRHQSRSKEKRRSSRSRSRDKRKKRSRSRHRHGSSRRRSSSRHRHSRKRSHERKRSRSRSPSHGRDRGSGGGGSDFPRYRGGRGRGGRGRGGRGGRRDSEEGSDRRGPGGPSSSAGGSGGKPLTFKEKMRQQLLETQRNLIESQLGNTSDGGEPAAPAQPPIAKPVNIQALLAMGGGKATPQQALAQAMAAMHQKAQALTGVKVPEYYNMAAVNPLKYAEQMKKRKMLWSKSKDNKEADKQWSSTVFQPESGGDNQTSKFRKLMGIKPGEGSDVPIDEKITEEQLRKQEELFRQLDREYEFARMTTHTHRGVGLGFQSQGLP